MEIWKDISGYEGLYQASSFGRILSLKRGIILKQQLNPSGYYYVALSKDGKGKRFLVSRLIAKNFIPNPYNLPEVNHKDENPKNNAVENLEWCSVAYNNTYGNRTANSAESNKNGIRSKKVYQYDLNGNFIKEYPSQHQASRDNNYSQGNISSCLRGKVKQAYGYVWKYKKDAS